MPSPGFIVLDGETFQTVNGAPALIKFLPGDPNRPLVVCIPGGGHTARIFYGGHPGGRDEDFLSFWLNKHHGFGVLCLSYPAESQDGPMHPPAPGYTVQDWGSQAAMIAADYIRQYEVSLDVLLVAWSMGGRLLEPFSTSAASLGINVRLAVSMAATPGIFGLRQHPTGIKMSPVGYAYKDGTSSHFIRQLQTENKVNGGREIIDPVSLGRFYLSTTPVNLTGWGLRYSQKDGQPQFEENDWADIQDARVHNWSSLPLTAVIQPTNSQDLMHALGDKATWGLVLTFKLICDFEKTLQSMKNINPDRFRNFRDLVDEIPRRLSRRVEGNHYFFLGERGAKDTAEKIVELLGTSEKVQGEIDVLMTG